MADAANTADRKDAAHFNRIGKGTLPEHIGMVVNTVGEQRLTSELAIRPHHLAPNGFLHAGTIVTLADTSCGYACVAHLPEGASNLSLIHI